MARKFQLREEYQALGGGTVVVPPDGNSLDVVAALEAHGGSLVVDDLGLINALETYSGAHGPVLSAEDTDESVNLTRDDVVGGPPPVPQAETPQQRTGGDAPVEVQTGTGAQVPADHGDDNASPYEGMTVDELKGELEVRGLEATGKKAELAAALEANDKERSGGS